MSQNFDVIACSLFHVRHTDCKHREYPYHFEGSGLDEDGLCEGAVRGLGDEDALPGEDLDDAPVVEVVVVGVGVEVRQRQAVQLRVRQAVHDVRLQVLDALKGQREGDTYRVFEVNRD